MNLRRNAKGFTLIEMIVVIVLVGILAAMGTTFIFKPIEGYVDLERRAALVDVAESSLRRMQREIRNALPNSIRIRPEGNGNGAVFELVPIRTGGRYRVAPGGAGLGNADCRLQFNLAAGDDSFDSLNDLDGFSVSASDRLVISNWSSSNGSAANVYTGDNITPAGTTITIRPNEGGCGGEDRIELSSPFRFPYPSDRQRYFLVETPVAYVCDTSSGTLTRYEGHGFVSNQASVDTAAELTTAGSSGALVTRNITGCTMTYNAGAPERGGLVTLDLTLTDPASSERVRLLHQVHVINAP